MARRYEQICPIARTLDLIGERWTLLILRDIYLGYRKFSEIKRRSPGIPVRLLSQRIHKLEDEGVVERVVYSERPLRAEYRLTEFGLTLAPILDALFRWGLDHALAPDERGIVLRHLYGGGVSADAPAGRLSLPQRG